MHTHTHTLTRTRTHSHTHASTLSVSGCIFLLHTHTHTHTHMHTCTYTHSLSLTHTHTHMHTCTYTHSHTHTHTNTHMHTCTYTHSLTLGCLFLLALCRLGLGCGCTHVVCVWLAWQRGCRNVYILRQAVSFCFSSETTLLFEKGECAKTVPHGEPHIDMKYCITAVQYCPKWPTCLQCMSYQRKTKRKVSLNTFIIEQMRWNHPKASPASSCGERRATHPPTMLYCGICIED
jgi:hypothetical protein